MDASLPRICLFFIVWIITAAECSEVKQSISCVSTYPTFEEAAIANNTNNVHALFSTLYPPNQPLPYSITILYQVRLNNGTVQSLSSDPNCSSELWLWTYSPVFMLYEPSLLNKMTYYALNNLQSWTSPTVTLNVPRPCSNATFRFLNEMTMTVNNYALGNMHEKKNLGFVLYCCGKKAENCATLPTSPHDDHLAMKQKISGLRMAFSISSLLQIIFVCLGTSMLLQNWLPMVNRGSQHTKAYGTFWAMTTTSAAFLVILMAADLYSFTKTVRYHPYLTTIALVMFTFSTIIQLPIALYFGRKYAIAVPCIFIVPTRLAFCGNKRHAASLVRTVFLQMSLTAVQLVSIHSPYLILAFGAAPFVICTNITMAIFCFFGMVHILAILFTLPCLRRQLGAGKKEGCQTILQGVSLIILLIAMFLFTLVLASAGYIINIGTDQLQGSFLFALNKVALPLGLCMTGVLLKRFSAMWWQAMLTKQNEQEVDEPKIGYDSI